MNVVLTWAVRRDPPVLVEDEWARSRGVQYHVFHGPSGSPEAVSCGATANGLSLGNFDPSASGRTAAHAACQRHANRIGDYLDGTSSCRNATHDRAGLATHLRATHAALTQVLSSYGTQ